MKPHPIIPQLVDLLGGPSLFPHLTQDQVHELIEERLADLLAEIHACRRHQMINEYLSATTECSVAAAREIGVSLSPAFDHNRMLPSTVDAEGVAFYPGVARGLSVDLEAKARRANEFWSRIPAPIGPLAFKSMLQFRAKISRGKAAHA